MKRYLLQPRVKDSDSSGTERADPLNMPTLSTYPLSVISENQYAKTNSDGSERTTTAVATTGRVAEDSNSDQVDPNCEPAQKRRKSYHQRFRDGWQHSFSWLEKRSDKSFCTACVKTIHGGITHLKRHEATDHHKENMKKADRTVKIDEHFTNKAQRQEKLVKSAELKLTMFLHEHNLPFLLMDHLPKLISSVCPHSKVASAIKCCRTKATNLTKDVIAKDQLSTISDKLRHTVFSIIIDETTDINTEKSLAIVVRFYDSGECKDRFFGLIKVQSCTAENIFNATYDCFKEKNIPITNMIGLAADNASVMMGNINGVKARFKALIPHLFVLGCVCHSFHLCSSAAAKKLPRSLEDLIRAIYSHFAHSSNRSGKLREFQIFVELKPHKLLHPSATRWLSLQAAVDRVLENWEALILFFTHEYFEDDLPATQVILNQLKNPVFKVYYTFLSYILESVNRLNREFQAEKPQLHLLLKRVSDLFRNILRNYMKKDYLDRVPIKDIAVTDPRNFIPLEKIYFGAKVEIAISNKDIDQKELQNFTVHALSFYVMLAEQIKKRFNFNDPVLTFVSYFNPRIVLSGEISSIATQALALFPHLVDDIEKLDSEWRLLPDLDELTAQNDLSMEEFWTAVFKLNTQLNIPMFPNLSKLVKGILCLPHSSAAAERVFSQLHLIKNKTRNRLHISTCESILHAKESLSNNSCYTWEPHDSLLSK